MKLLQVDIPQQILFSLKVKCSRTFVAEGWNDRNNQVKFTKWKKLDELPEECSHSNLIESACNPNPLNLEFVDGKIIECHLRHGNPKTLPEKATEIILPILTQMKCSSLHGRSRLPFQL